MHLYCNLKNTERDIWGKEEGMCVFYSQFYMLQDDKNNKFSWFIIIRIFLFLFFLPLLLSLLSELCPKL